MRCALMFLFTLVFCRFAQAQTGPCTEKALKQGNLPFAEDAFSFMPPYGKPVTGTAATEEAAKKGFSDRINRKFEWVGDHRIVASASGDMAYEHGTMHVSYDDKSDGKAPHLRCCHAECVQGEGRGVPAGGRNHAPARRYRQVGQSIVSKHRRASARFVHGQRLDSDSNRQLRVLPPRSRLLLELQTVTV